VPEFGELLPSDIVNFITWQSRLLCVIIFCCDDHSFFPALWLDFLSFYITPHRRQDCFIVVVRCLVLFWFLAIFIVSLSHYEDIVHMRIS
jgi:hypothetical protein